MSTSKRSHPLSKEEEWFFAQHHVELRSVLFRIAQPKVYPKVTNRRMVIRGESSCREGLIHGIRRSIAKALGREMGGLYSWNREYTRHSDPDMDRECLKQPGQSWVGVQQTHITGMRYMPNPQYKVKGSYSRNQKLVRRNLPGGATEDEVESFLRMCDAVVGPITVLLNPDRYQGNWWWTGVEDARRGNGMLRWYGIDNTAAWHPALASLYTGLVRQCAFMARTGVADRVLSDVEGLNLEECLNESDDVLARKIVKKMGKWIAVPNPKSGSVGNIPVPVDTLGKIMDLHKVIYDRGFEATFGKSFIVGWNATSPYGGYNNHTGNANFQGIHSFMGIAGQKGRGKTIRRLATEIA